MLSSVLRSPKAITINIEIMRAFSRYRAMLKDNDEIHFMILGNGGEKKRLQNRVQELALKNVTFLDAVHTVVSSDYVGAFYNSMSSQMPGEHLFLQGAIGGWVQPDKGDNNGRFRPRRIR